MCRGLCRAPGELSTVERESKMETPWLELRIYLGLSREETVSVQRATGNVARQVWSLKKDPGERQEVASGPDLLCSASMPSTFPQGSWPSCSGHCALSNKIGYL